MQPRNPAATRLHDVNKLLAQAGQPPRYLSVVEQEGTVR